jgi:cytochrome P450
METRMTSTQATARYPIVPPAPNVPAEDPPAWRVLRDFPRNTLSSWPEAAFNVPIRRRRIFGIDGVLINDADAVRHVLTTGASNYKRTIAFVRLFRPLVGNGLFLAEGDAWRMQRRLLAPIFTPASVANFIPHFQVAADDLMQRLSETASEANLAAAFRDAAADAALRSMFTLPEPSLRRRLAVMAPGYLTGPGAPNVFDVMARSEQSWQWPMRRRHRYLKEWFAAFDDIIAERRRTGPPELSRDMLDLLLAARDPETGDALNNDDIRYQCSTMLAAGFETTARLLFWAAYLLCLDPAEQERVRAEVIGAPSATGKQGHVPRWPLLRQVLLETLRLYPPAPLITREAIAPDRVLGVDIQPGTQIFISPWVIHRHRQYWDQPTVFMPSRFKDQPVPWTSGNFIPFGGGPHICIGAAFAMAEAEIILATVLTFFRISAVDTQPVLPVGRITNMPSYEPRFRLERIN